MLIEGLYCGINETKERELELLVSWILFTQWSGFVVQKLKFGFVT